MRRNTVDIEELESVRDWAAYYRQWFHLAAEERGGYVMLPITSTLAIVHMPELLAERVLASLRRQSSPGPLLARQIRWSFVTAVDYSPGYQILDLLARNNICVPAVGNALMIPTSLGRWTREGAHWVNPPHRDEPLPSLSTVITTALAVATGHRF
ncbi:hypothetical protein ACQPW1_05460 [Nocardia sp. CA-128927]|uniref:hypothetical protein n=1 Tax=Nocardia sp. CA-128927 TaxID=3239975 RepID=UPI003D98EFDD